MAIDPVAPALHVRGLNVRYGSAHVLHNLDLTLQCGVLALVGRNGMGKTTLCRALMGMTPVNEHGDGGSITSFGLSLQGKDTDTISRQGLGYVPQGRRLWPSLTVLEHLRVAECPHHARWHRERVFTTFPKLYERRTSAASRLSGGEQQMLAIARALLSEPALLVMDEPTEGLAPIIVDQVVALIQELVRSDGMAVLLVEQNLGVALDTADSMAVLTNGCLSTPVTTASLRGDVALQRELLGFARH